MYVFVFQKMSGEKIKEINSNVSYLEVNSEFTDLYLFTFTFQQSALDVILSCYQYFCKKKKRRKKQEYFNTRKQ